MTYRHRTQRRSRSAPGSRKGSTLSLSRTMVRARMDKKWDSSADCATKVEGVLSLMAAGSILLDVTHHWDTCFSTAVERLLSFSSYLRHRVLSWHFACVRV